jgi:hypothetical protein
VLDEIATPDVERFIEGLLTTVSQATANRYRDRLSAMFTRAKRLGLIPRHSNPVTTVPKFRETGGRLVCLTGIQESAVRDALSLQMRPYFDFAINSGFRWSKQVELRWLDVEMLSKVLTIGKDKEASARPVQLGGGVRAPGDGYAAVTAERPARARVSQALPRT